MLADYRGLCYIRPMPMFGHWGFLICLGRLSVNWTSDAGFWTEHDPDVISFGVFVAIGR